MNGGLRLQETAVAAGVPVVKGPRAAPGVGGYPVRSTRTRSGPFAFGNENVRDLRTQREIAVLRTGIKPPLQEVAFAVHWDRGHWVLLSACQGEGDIAFLESLVWDAARHAYGLGPVLDLEREISREVCPQVELILPP
jgi:hypothetical protein